MSHTRDSFTISSDILQNKFSSWLDEKSLKESTSVCHSFNTLFKNPPLASARLLLLLAHGNQIEAKTKIQNNLRVLIQKSQVIDDANRIFDEIMPFQLAWWYKDTHAVKMILEYLPKHEAAKQLAELSSSYPPAYLQKHGRHFDIKPLLEAYNAYLDFYDQIDWNLVDYWEQENYWHQANFDQYNTQIKPELDRLWLEIGKEQRHVPVHVINEYFHPNRSFVLHYIAPPQFNEEEGLPRNTRFSDNTSFYPLLDGSGPGIDYTLARFDRVDGALADKRHITGHRGLDVTALMDYVAISHLDVVRTNELDQIERELNSTLELEGTVPIHRVF